MNLATWILSFICTHIAQLSLLYRQVSEGEGQQERTESMQIRTDRRRKLGLQDASEQDPDQNGSPREGARKIRK